MDYLSLDHHKSLANTVFDDLSTVVEPRWKRKKLDHGHSSTTTTATTTLQPIVPTSSQQPMVTTPTVTTSTMTTSTMTSSYGDRFIPNRKSQDLDLIRFKLYSNNENFEPNSSGNNKNHTEDPIATSNYCNSLEQRMFDGNTIQSYKILTLSEKAPQNHLQGWQNNLRVLYSQNKAGGLSSHTSNSADASAKKKNQFRYIPNSCEKMLDAPCLIDDYYLNLLDWSSQNILAIALADKIYLWNAENSTITPLLETEGTDNYVTSLSFLDDGSYLAVGTNYNDVQIWDINKMKQVRNMKGHTSRVGSLSWNSHILSSGSRDGIIVNHDVRKPQHLINSLQGHDQEICGLKWSTDGTQLASGGNDNVLNIWDLSTCTSSSGTAPRFRITDHCAAVKALAWCPWQQNLLASGGGTADRKINFWNTSSGALVNSIDTRSQVCSIVWSKYDRELVSSHGFSQNQLIVWKYPSLVKMAELTGHTSRVLHMAQSPDGSCIVSAAGDETLRFWKIFSSASDVSLKSKYSNTNSALSIKSMSIR